MDREEEFGVGRQEILSSPESSRPASKLLFNGHRGSFTENEVAGCVNFPIHIHRVEVNP
jgi:hypothetical protein